MALPTSFSQASLSAAVLSSTVGTYIALSPPNPSTNPIPSHSDWVARFHLTRTHSLKVAIIPLGFVALHASSIAWSYPNVPASLLRYGAENGLHEKYITWSPATAIPLALIFCAGIPLRLASYASLGKNFTFALTQPDRLKTSGMYKYVQHPSYTGLMVLAIANVALLGHHDGVLSCWVPPERFEDWRSFWWTFAPVGFAVFLLGMWKRVQQEERMLKARFGKEWEGWHARTARFVPWLF